jgi:predicted ATPase with chaperone activity
MIGSPDAGKWMLAARLPSILPLPSGTIRLEAAAFFAAGLFRVGSRRPASKSRTANTGHEEITVWMSEVSRRPAQRA